MQTITSRFVEVEGRRAHYTQAGAGPAILLLASMFVRARSYVPTIEALAPAFRVITVELPGSGQSVPLPTPWTFEHYAQWTLAFVEALNLQNATLIGHSNSGPVALLAATHDAPRISRIVLADSVGAHPNGSLPLILAGRAIDAVLEPMLSIRGWPDIAYNVAHHTRNAFHQLALCNDNIVPRAKEVRTPALLAWGARDHTTPVSAVNLLARNLPSPRIYISRSGSHDWMIDQAPEFARMMHAFVPRPPGAAP